jgi:hypothetical protein
MSAAESSQAIKTRKPDRALACSGFQIFYT